MTPITKDMIELTYTKALSIIEEKSNISDTSKDINKKKSNISDASEDINKKTGMTTASAIIYIHCVIALRRNESYGKTVNGEAVEYFLGKIREDFGDEGCLRAIKVIKQHIKSNSNPQKNIKRIIDRFEKLLSE